MKKLIIILLFSTIIADAQNFSNYKEYNFGIYLGDYIPVFPGMSFLLGQTVYFSNYILLDYQIGFAVPTIGTGKIGLGIGNEKNSILIGIRPWPPSGFAQYTFNKKQTFSFEVMPPLANTNSGISGLIINYGYRF